MKLLEGDVSVLETDFGWEVRISFSDGDDFIFRARNQTEMITALAKAHAHSIIKFEIRQQEIEREERG